MTAALATLDDAEIMRMSVGGGADALEELERRKRFEAAWSGEWHEQSTRNWPPPDPKRKTKTLAQWHPDICREIAARRKSRRKPLPAVPLVDGRESQFGRWEKLPRNNKERFQANIARFSKLNDVELRMIAMQRTGPESKAARYLLEWRTTHQTPA